MNEEELKEMYKGLKRNKKIIGSIDTDFFFEFAEIVLNLLEKKDKIINEIIGFLSTRTWATCPNEDCGTDLDCENRCSNDDNIYEECWKIYFERKVENG